jgi:hypothetical protein
VKIFSTAYHLPAAEMQITNGSSKLFFSSFHRWIAPLLKIEKEAEQSIMDGGALGAHSGLNSRLDLSSISTSECTVITHVQENITPYKPPYYLSRFGQNEYRYDSRYLVRQDVIVFKKSSLLSASSSHDF